MLELPPLDIGDIIVVFNKIGAGGIFILTFTLPNVKYTLL